MYFLESLFKGLTHDKHFKNTVAFRGIIDFLAIAIIWFLLISVISARWLVWGVYSSFIIPTSQSTFEWEEQIF